MVRYMWWFVGISGLLCFTNGTWIIIGENPLETFQSAWMYSPTERNGHYRRRVSDTEGHEVKKFEKHCAKA